jgi:DnaJ-class molecular chaperone
MICDRCEGDGIIFDRRKKFYEQWESWYETHTSVCPKCHGDGKLDWIENIVGKKESNKKSQTVHHGACLGCVTSSKLCPKCKYYKNLGNKPSLRKPRF